MVSFAIQEVKSHGTNLDDFASYQNCVVDKYISLGFQIEAAGTNFFAQMFVKSDIILIHPMLYDALTHISQFICEVAVIMHLWQG